MISDVKTVDIGTRIKEICKKRKISVAKVERMAGIPEKSISKWDKNNPSFDKVQRVMDALEISYEELMNIGSPETQKIQTALVQIRLASPEVYDEIIRKWLAPELNKKMPVDIYDEHYDSNKFFIETSSDGQRELIKEVLRLSEEQISAFLSLAKSLPDHSGVQDDQE